MARSGLPPAALLAGLLTLAGSASAQQEAIARGACQADAQRLCAGVQPGHGRIATCLMDKHAELSPECTQELEQMRARAKGFAEACKSDIQKYCKGMRPGGGRLAKCLKDNQSKLSPACQEAFGQARPKRDEAPKAQ
jgi:hypothetical protein